MQFIPTAHIQALGAQQRFFDAARLDGAVEPAHTVGPVRHRLATLLNRAPRPLAPNRLPARRVAA